MAFDFKLPDLGENVTSGDVVDVLVNEGDQVEAGQSVIEMETEKAVVEVPCPQAGRVAKIHVSKGDNIRIGAPVLTLEGDGEAEREDAEEEEKEEEEAEPSAKRPPSDEERDEKKEADEKPKERRKDGAREGREKKERKKKDVTDTQRREPKRDGSPAAFIRREAARPSIGAGPGTRRLARELGVDLADVEGTGPSGRITRADVEAAAPKEPARREPSADAEADKKQEATESDKWGPIRREPLTQIRKTIAAHMTHAAGTIPHVTHCDDADVTELEGVRRTADFEDLDPPVKVTMLAFVVKAVAHALKAHPRFNASFDADTTELVYKEYVNIGVAVDTDRGLIVPVLRDVDQMDILDIAYAAAEAAERVRSGRFDLEELRGGTFTISNVGAYGGIYSTPIIHHPEVAILLIGRARTAPVLVDGAFQARSMLPLSLSYDHRVLDGALAARFMNEIKQYLEAPGRLLLMP